MEYIVSHNKLMEVMKKFFERDGSELSFPLHLEKKGRRAYNYSSEYTYYTLEYLDPKTGEILFKNFSDLDKFEEVAWQVNDRFLNLYEFFGEKAFQEFVKYYYGLDINEKGSKKEDWVFR